VTLEDIIEELVGDIEDEYDRLPSFMTPTGDGFIVGGGIPLASVMHKFELPMPDLKAAAASGVVGAPANRPASRTPTATAQAIATGPTVVTAPPLVKTPVVASSPPAAPSPASSVTIADWAHERLGHAPTGGESINADGIQLLIRKLRRKRVAEAFVRRR
jgi:CBS domain containing-hemolysin-like protein